MTPTKIIKAAMVAHETNRAWCEANGDMSQPSWEDAPDWQRESAIAGMKFHLANPNAGDSASHNSWMNQKLVDGWVWGEVKDPEANPPTHPCLVPFEELPLEQQIKDSLFRSVAHSILNIKSTVHSGLPVAGYQKQADQNVTLVNTNKNLEEKILQVLDSLAEMENTDKRWLAIGRTDIEKGFMSVNRSIFKPERVHLSTL